MSNRFRSFRSDPEIDQILDNVEFRQKSKFIKAAIVHYADDGRSTAGEREPPGAPEANRGLRREAEPEPTAEPGAPGTPKGYREEVATQDGEPLPTPGSEDTGAPDPQEALREDQVGPTLKSSEKPSPKPANSNTSRPTSNDSEPPSSETANTTTTGVTSLLARRQTTRG